ncbi:hypothetical protein [Actinacidiphila reveromycinica]|nr:hypothetical protein [Streptomyces sp. SN-593]
MIAALAFGASEQASAAVPPANVGWLYTTSGSGAVFFDADLSGYPSMEKITVCDNRSDGRGIVATLTGTDPEGGSVGVIIRDPSNNGTCTADYRNYFADGYYVYVGVCEYWGDNEANCAYGTGVA